MFNGINMFIHSQKRYDIKINCFERATEMGVLNNLCICIKNCVWPLQKNMKPLGQILRSHLDSEPQNT